MNAASKEGKTAHTAGPWVVAERSEVVVCAGNDPSNPGRILFVLRDPIGTSQILPSDELEANAHLCASAPDLLKALEEAKACLTFYDIDAKCPRLMKQIDAAIARAKSAPEKEG